MTVRCVHTRALLSAVLVLGACLMPLSVSALDPNKIVEIQAASKAQVQQIADLGIDIWQVDGLKVVAQASAADLEALKSAGINFSVKAEDAQAYVQGLVAKQAVSAVAYHTYDTLNADLYALEASGIAKVYDIGDSIEGRDILAVRISDNPAVDEGEPAVFFPGCHHAREWISVEVSYYIAKYLVDNYGTDPEVTSLVDNGEIWVAPMVNPDGHQYSVGVSRLWRKNRRNNGGSYGVDLNRNYATGWGGAGSSSIPSSDTYHGTAPFSEPESQAVRDLFLDPAYDFKAVITYHSYSQLILWPWGYTNAEAPDNYKLSFIGEQMEALIDAVHGSNYTAEKSSTLYLASGTTDDWTYDVSGVPSYTIELRPISDIPGFVLPPEQIMPTAEENLPAALYLIGLTQNDDDGDGVVEIEDNCIGQANPSQVDADGDRIGPPCDCDDSNPNVGPGEVENCTNGIDDDCDTLVDSSDPDCSSSGWALARSAEASLVSGGNSGTADMLNALSLLVLPGLFLVMWWVRTRRS